MGNRLSIASREYLRTVVGAAGETSAVRCVRRCVLCTEKARNRKKKRKRENFRYNAPRDGGKWAVLKRQLKGRARTDGG